MQAEQSQQRHLAAHSGDSVAAALDNDGPSSGFVAAWDKDLARSRAKRGDAFNSVQVRDVRLPRSLLTVIISRGQQPT